LCFEFVIVVVVQGVVGLTTGDDGAVTYWFNICICFYYYRAVFSICQFYVCLLWRLSWLAKLDNGYVTHSNIPSRTPFRGQVCNTPMPACPSSYMNARPM